LGHRKLLCTLDEDWGEIALAKLDGPVEDLSPVALAEYFPRIDSVADIQVVTANPESKREASCQLVAGGRLLIREAGGGHTGDSGGAWLIRLPDGRDAVVGIVQGGPIGGKAFATPLVRFKDWINDTIGKSGASVDWVKVDRR
jgi:hypothetical protein